MQNETKPAAQRLRRRITNFLRIATTIAAALLLAGFALTGCAPDASGVPTAAPQPTDPAATQSPAPNADAATDPADDTAADAANASTAATAVTEDGTYTTKDEVAAYIHEFGHLPPNFVTKRDARAQGWDPKAGVNLSDVTDDPDASIGGDRFGNYDGLLPDAPKRRWTECDINYHGGKRGAERIVFSNDGLIYYTADHYQTFEQLY